MYVILIILPWTGVSLELGNLEQFLFINCHILSGPKPAATEKKTTFQNITL